MIEDALTCIENIDLLEAMSKLRDMSSANSSSFDSLLDREMTKGFKENSFHDDGASYSFPMWWCFGHPLGVINP